MMAAASSPALVNSATDENLAADARYVKNYDNLNPLWRPFVQVFDYFTASSTRKWSYWYLQGDPFVWLAGVFSGNKDKTAGGVAGLLQSLFLAADKNNEAYRESNLLSILDGRLEGKERADFVRAIEHKIADEKKPLEAIPVADAIKKPDLIISRFKETVLAPGASIEEVAKSEQHYALQVLKLESKPGLAGIWEKIREYGAPISSAMMLVQGFLTAKGGFNQKTKDGKTVVQLGDVSNGLLNIFGFGINLVSDMLIKMGFEFPANPPEPSHKFSILNPSGWMEWLGYARDKIKSEPSWLGGFLNMGSSASGLVSAAQFAKDGNLAAAAAQAAGSASYLKGEMESTKLSKEQKEKMGVLPVVDDKGEVNFNFFESIFGKIKHLISDGKNDSDKAVDKEIMVETAAVIASATREYGTASYVNLRDNILAKLIARSADHYGERKLAGAL